MTARLFLARLNRYVGDSGRGFHLLPRSPHSVRPPGVERRDDDRAGLQEDQRSGEDVPVPYSSSGTKRSGRGVAAAGPEAIDYGRARDERVLQRERVGRVSRLRSFDSRRPLAVPPLLFARGQEADL